MLKVSIFLTQFVLFVTCYDIEIVHNDVKPIIGESPHWDADTGSLYYIDLFNNRTSLYRYDFNEGKTYSASIPNESQMPGYIIPIEGCPDQYLVGLGRNNKVIKWDGVSPTAEDCCTQFTMDADIPTNRIHDSHADPNGDFYGGTTRASFCSATSTLPSGHVFKSTDGEPTEIVFDGQNGPNSMVWNTNNNKVFYVDSCRYEIRGYDWDPETTALSHEHVVFNLREYYNLTDEDILRQRPDGMAIDTAGHLYLAIVNSSAVWEIDPENLENPVVQLIKFPVPNIQSVAWGGPNLDILFATTSNFPLSALTGLPDPSQKLPADSGLLFMVKGLEAKGYNGRALKKSFASCAKKAETTSSEDSGSDDEEVNEEYDAPQTRKTRKTRRESFLSRMKHFLHKN